MLYAMTTLYECISQFHCAEAKTHFTVLNPKGGFNNLSEKEPKSPENPIFKTQFKTHIETQTQY